jgi:small-conductance mechanosensitive channel
VPYLIASLHHQIQNERKEKKMNTHDEQQMTKESKHAGKKGARTLQVLLNTTQANLQMTEKLSGLVNENMRLRNCCVQMWQENLTMQTKIAGLEQKLSEGNILATKLHNDLKTDYKSLADEKLNLEKKFAEDNMKLEHERNLLKMAINEFSEDCERSRQAREKYAAEQVKSRNEVQLLKLSCENDLKMVVAEREKHASEISELKRSLSLREKQLQQVNDKVYFWLIVMLFLWCMYFD